MNMLEWAKKEVEFACKRENPDRKEGEFDYGCACYESALKAFNSLLEDEHSGTSIHFTKNILVRLIEGKPLTPIEDVPENWDTCFCASYMTDEYWCTRMSSLIKTVYEDGRVTFKDINRTSVTYASNPGLYWTDGTASRIIDEMFPITMPYWPEQDRYIVYAEDFLVDPKNGVYDTVGYLYVVTPSGEKLEINRFFKDGSEGYHPMVEITKEEYLERKAVAINDLSESE